MIHLSLRGSKSALCILTEVFGSSHLSSCNLLGAKKAAPAFPFLSPPSLVLLWTSWFLVRRKQMDVDLANILNYLIAGHFGMI